MIARVLPLDIPAVTRANLVKRYIRGVLSGGNMNGETPRPGPGTGLHGWTEANAAEIAAVIDGVIAREALRLARENNRPRPEQQRSPGQQ